MSLRACDSGLTDLIQPVGHRDRWRLGNASLLNATQGKIESFEPLRPMWCGACRARPPTTLIQRPGSRS